MKIDEVDISILKECFALRNDKEKSTWGVAKKIFDLKDKDWYNLRRSNNIVKNRMIRMSPDLFFIAKNPKTGVNDFNLILDNVKFSKMKFPSGIRQALFVRINGRWTIFELGELKQSNP